MEEWLLLAQAFPGSQVAWAAIVTFGVFSLFRGWIIPRITHLERIADKDAQIKALAGERDDWKGAFMKSEEARNVLNRQNGELIDSAEATNRLIESLRNLIERGAEHTDGG